MIRCPRCGNDTYRTVWDPLVECQACGMCFSRRVHQRMRIPGRPGGGLYFPWTHIGRFFPSGKDGER